MQRFYRDNMNSENLVYFRVAVKETDLYVGAENDLSDPVREIIIKYRNILEEYIVRHKGFASALAPISLYKDAPDIAIRMADAARAAKVGPMAAVAGAFSQILAEELDCDELIIENGGDLYIKSQHDRIVSIYPGENKFKGRLNLHFSKEDMPLSVCTSSSKLGHSLSFGKADSVSIISHDAFLADAMATSVCNMIQKSEDIPRALEFAQSVDGVLGAVAIIDNKLGAFGLVEFV
ncbi:MAG: UPF0280 family protein [Anaerofustis stercorihominis]|nr:UPF0280 family protein [Anaerofustis stercorihominis]